jgi:hypothetical protein
MAGRSLWALAGAAVATAALVASPETYRRLRVRVGLEHDAVHFEEELDAPYPGDAPADTHEARMSLRARLADLPESAAEAPTAGAPQRPRREDHGDLRSEVELARARTREKARAAAAGVADAPTDSSR